VGLAQAASGTVGTLSRLFAEFEGGPWDGCRLPWPGSAPDFPLAFRFEGPVSDPPITADPATDLHEYLRQLMDSRIVARRSFLYEASSHAGTAVDDPDDVTITVSYRFAGVETVPHREPVAP
jgi:hypothetical protein